MLRPHSHANKIICDENFFPGLTRVKTYLPGTARLVSAWFRIDAVLAAFASSFQVVVRKDGEVRPVGQICSIGKSAWRQICAQTLIDDFVGARHLDVVSRYAAADCKSQTLG
jgi:hypothetical protein